MALLIKNVRVVDPQVKLDKQCDLLVEDGHIAEVGQNLSAKQATERDCKGKYLLPGLVDIHVHLRDPGQEYKEDIESGTRAAAHGGFTDVCCMPNTKPVIDKGAVVEYVRSKAEKVGKCRVHVAAACTAELKGVSLAEMGDAKACGAVMFTDDGRGVQDAGMMRRVMEYARQFGCVVASHCQDESLVGSGQMNEGAVSTRLGMQGWPALGEELQIERDIELSRLTDCPVHIQHLTTAHGLDIVRRAKAEGVKVTCEVTPHHLFLNEDDIDETYNASLKVNPPLRRAEDNEALIEGLCDGTIDCIVTDHAPHALYEKEDPFEQAPFGMIGLETSLALVLTHLLHTKKISWERIVELMSINPRRILGLDPVCIKAGSRADFTIIDPDEKWVVNSDDFESKATNSGFLGCELKGKATDVYLDGCAIMENGLLV